MEACYHKVDVAVGGQCGGQTYQGGMVVAVSMSWEAVEIGYGDWEAALEGIGWEEME